MLDKINHQFSNDTILQCATNFETAQSPKELIELWKKSFHGFGFDHLSYNLFSGFRTHEKHPLYKIHVSNIPKKIEDVYFTSKAKQFDPFLNYTFSTMDPIWLTDAGNLPYFQKKGPAHYLDTALKYVSDGLCVPMIGPSFLKGYIFAAYKKTDAQGRMAVTQNQLTIWHIMGLCKLLHTRYCKLYLSKQIKVELTKREMDVLHLVVAGKTNREIGAALGISINTVNTYLKNLFLKMNTTDRVTTALKAYSLNIITSPQDMLPDNYLRESA